MNGNVEWLVSVISSADQTLYYIYIYIGLGGYVFASQEYKNLYTRATDEMHLITTLSLEDIGKNIKEGKNFKLDVCENISPLVAHEL